MYARLASISVPNKRIQMKAKRSRAMVANDNSRNSTIRMKARMGRMGLVWGRRYGRQPFRNRRIS